MNNMSMSYIIMKDVVVSIRVYYILGTEYKPRGYYYRTNEAKIEDGLIKFLTPSNYTISEQFIEATARFNAKRFENIKNIAIGQYFNFLNHKRGLDIDLKDVEVLKDKNELFASEKIKKIEDKYNDPAEKLIDDSDNIHFYSPTLDNESNLNNVILNKEVKESIVQTINFIKNKSAYDKIGAKMPKGILLYGPPGTGKTTIAKTIAKETNAKFYSVAGCEFIEKYVGVGAKRIRTLFERARENQPSIIFIDEFDAVASAREGESNKETAQTLNQLLIELDGFKPLDNVIVIAATNRLDMLDSAATRPGRFDRKLLVDLPDEENRVNLFKLFLKTIVTDSNIDYNLLAIITENNSGAEIANICNEAAIKAVSENRQCVTQNDLEYIIEKINKKSDYAQRRAIGFM